MVETEKRAVKDLVCRPCWGGFRRHSVENPVCRSCCGKVKRRSTGDFKCKSRWRAFDSCWETGLEGSRARCNLGLRYKRCRFPPVHYLTKFPVWIPLLEKTGNCREIFAGDGYPGWG